MDLPLLARVKLVAMLGTPCCRNWKQQPITNGRPPSLGPIAHKGIILPITWERILPHPSLERSWEHYPAPWWPLSQDSQRLFFILPWEGGNLKRELSEWREVFKKVFMNASCLPQALCTIQGFGLLGNVTGELSKGTTWLCVCPLGLQGEGRAEGKQYKWKAV